MNTIFSLVTALALAADSWPMLSSDTAWPTQAESWPSGRSIAGNATVESGPSTVNAGSIPAGQSGNSASTPDEDRQSLDCRSGACIQRAYPAVFEEHQARPLRRLFFRRRLR